MIWVWSYLSLQKANVEHPTLNVQHRRLIMKSAFFSEKFSVPKEIKVRRSMFNVRRSHFSR